MTISSAGTEPPGANEHPLVQAAGRFGAVGPIRRLKSGGWLPAKCSMYTAFIGNTRVVAGQRYGCEQGIFGTGRAYGDPARARLLAVSEALERYASTVITEKDLTTASAAELGENAMDLDRVPRCSARERRRPGCPVREPDKAAPIRWRKGVNLHSGAEVLVPAVMASLGVVPEPTELFWLAISTGAAAHITMEAAVVNGICEVIERDAVALAWLQCLPLPRLAAECVPGPARELILWCDQRGIDTHLFDATTDLGVPTVYCLQTTRDAHLQRAAQLVGTATDFDVHSAVLHAVLEAVGLRGMLCNRACRRGGYAGYQGIDGAITMGRRGRRDAFRFLLDGLAERPVSSPRSSSFSSDAERLEFLLRRLAERGMTVYAVDIGTRELEDAGLAAAYVIIPELQPMSLRPLVQYRAHPRLYQAPAAMGMPVRPEHRLNPYPQPVS